MKQISNLNFQEAKHLVERTGLGAELDIIQGFVGKSLDTCLGQLFNIKPSLNESLPGLLSANELSKKRQLYIKNNQRQKIGKLIRKQRAIFQIWGMNNLIESKSILHERMVWFWHNHFTSSVKQVQNVNWMFQQDLSIRENAIGDFSNLLKSMSFDSAMLIYLDGRSNKKGKPNENFSRELLELFTLGEGYYSEKDVKESAKAFTGWIVDAKNNKSKFVQERHDSGLKEFMGEKGNFTANDILDILLKHSRTAEFISEKLWFEFVSILPPETKVIKSWAKVFRTSNYDISKLLETIFKSESFWNEKYRGTLIKSPIELVIGTLRTLDLEDIDNSSKFFLTDMRRMGQELYAPPNVKGWIGGKTWIDDDSLLRRQRFLKRILRGQTGAKEQKNMSVPNMRQTSMEVMSDSMQTSLMQKKSEALNYELPDLSEEQWSEWLLAVPAVLPINKKTKQTRLASILLDPAYQLK